MSECGVVESIEEGIATVRLTRTEACGKCGLCACGSVAGSMLLRAYAPAGTQVGERVEVEVDRGMRWHAQAWLLAMPLGVFLGVAWVVREFCHVREVVALSLGILGMACAYGMVWRLDRRGGWSTRPVARIVRRLGSDAQGEMTVMSG